jgi:hypothetical protein
MHKDQNDKSVPAGPKDSFGVGRERRNISRLKFTCWQTQCERRLKKKSIFHFLVHFRQYNADAFVFGSDKNTDCPLKYFKSAIFARPTGTIIQDSFLLIFIRAGPTHKFSEGVPSEQIH